MIMDQFVWDEIMAEAMLDEDRLLQIENNDEENNLLHLNGETNYGIDFFNRVGLAMYIEN
jgi:hypothetical protein